MDKVIGRNYEKDFLTKALLSNEPELIAIIGRRRIGKTFLIRQTYAKHINFDMVGLQNGTLHEPSPFSAK